MKQHVLCFLLMAGFTAQAQEVKTINFPNGDTYEGQVNAQGIPDGKGKGIFTSSHMLYEGNWENGTPNGNGKLVQWKMIAGMADTTDRYTGEVVKGKITGNGVYTKVGKWVYTGGFLEGKFNGKGKKTYSNKEFIDGIWDKGILTNGNWSVTTLQPFKISVYDEKSRKAVDKYGYKTADGNIVIQAKYIGAEKFSEGLAAVRTDVFSKDYTQDWGYIDIHNNLKIDFKYSKANPFSDGLAAVGIWDKENRVTIYCYIDKTGKLAFAGEYDFARDFSEGLAAVVKDDKYGYINKKGTLIIPFQYEDAEGFRNGRAVVKNKNFKYGLIDIKGKLLAPFVYEEISDFHEGMARVQKGLLPDGNRKYGYINQAGKLVIPAIYEFGFDFENGKVKVTDDKGRYFYIDKTGKEIVEEN
ncbi:MAG: WG repeat-containing protein [Chitinophagaceae bacterium]|nr:WG repeat-containing protein [Chitinophagaceae bacterium]